MRVFLYEFITGGGLIGEPLPPSLLREGAAMIAALAADFVVLPAARVSVLRDARLAEPGHSPFPPQLPLEIVDIANATEERVAFQRLAGNADWTMVIAPEFSGHLLERVRWVQAAGGRLLGPAPPLVELLSDKHRTAEHLRAAGVRTPEGHVLPAGSPLPRNFAYPAVRKPLDGAGSLDVQLIPSPHADIAPAPVATRLEQFQPGLAVSVAHLCGPAGHLPLAACRQHLTPDGRFAYLGGTLPLPPALARRALGLAGRAMAALDVPLDRPLDRPLAGPGDRPLGYIGADLVLGPAEDGSQDVIIEINPRLTTSYVGLRAAAEQNLAAAMLSIAVGTLQPITWRPNPIAFTAAGEVHIDSPGNAGATPATDLLGPQ